MKITYSLQKEFRILGNDKVIFQKKFSRLTFVGVSGQGAGLSHDYCSRHSALCSGGSRYGKNLVRQRRAELGGENRPQKMTKIMVGKRTMERYVLDLFIALLISSRGGMFSLSISTSWSMSETGFGVFSYS